MLTTGCRNPPGLRLAICNVLQSIEQGQSLSMGELITRLDIDKRFASEVSSALYKLRKAGRVRVSEGQATSALGRRIVRRYGWINAPVVVKPMVVVIPAPHPLNSLFLRRG